MSYYSGMPGFAMALVYICIGTVLILNTNISFLAGYQKYGLAALLFLYGVFRLYRFFIKRKEESNDEDQE